MNIYRQPTHVRCCDCKRVFPVDHGTNDNPIYHLEPGTSLRKCPGSDKPGVVASAQEAKRA